MRIFSAALKYILLLQYAFSLSLSQHKGDDVIMDGVDAFFNYDFEKSIEIPLRRVGHGHWCHYYYHSTFNEWSRYLSIHAQR